VQKIVEEVPRSYQFIRDACRTRVQGERPQLDEAAVDEFLKMVPMPPIRMVEKALADRLHLPEAERMQQVAAMIVPKLLGEPL
jgi:predicted anti-sigma-YlaC factor YlaD